MEHKPRIRIRQKIPNILTLLNLTAGFVSITYSIRGLYTHAAFLIFVAMVFDFFDGYFARLFDINGRFGLELDSLSDVVSFGVAPAILIYTLYLDALWIPVIVLIPLCGEIRLARFNIMEKQKGFVGLPIPSVGGFLASLVFLESKLNPIMLVFITVVLSYLMISWIRYPDFKRLNPKNNKSKITMLVVLFSLAAPIFDLSLLFVPFLVYILSGIFMKIFRKEIQ